MGKHYNHLLDRHTVIWRSLGKYGRGPIRETLIKELSDEHLMKIIEFINRNPEPYNPELLRFMEDEVIYRADNNIHVFEYYGDQDNQTGKLLYKIRTPDTPFEDDDELQIPADDPFWNTDNNLAIQFGIDVDNILSL